MTLPVAFHDLPAENFPFTVEFFRGDELVHTIRVEGPGGIYIPPLGGVTRTRMICDNGDVGEYAV